MARIMLSEKVACNTNHEPDKGTEIIGVGIQGKDSSAHSEGGSGERLGRVAARAIVRDVRDHVETAGIKLR